MSRFITLDRIKYLYQDFLVKMLSDESRKPFFTQLSELFQLTLDKQFFPHNYFKYEGFKQGSSLADIKKYAPGILFDEFRKDVLNDKRYAVFADDKYLFHRLMDEINVPTATLLGVLNVKKGVFQVKGDTIAAEDFLNSLDETGIVIKPVIDSNQGTGVIVLDVNQGQRRTFRTNVGEFTATQLLNHIGVGHENADFLVEKKLAQHASLNEFYNLSVNTVRVDTLITEEGDVLINSAYLRVGRNGRRVDNWSGKQGGIGIQVDINTGQLNALGVDYSLVRYSEHPETKKQFSGFTVPFWEEITQLVARAALSFPNLRSQGWDIAVTEEGPLLIEVNQDYDVLAQQTCTHAFGVNQKIRAAFYHYAMRAGNQKYIKMFKD